MNHENQKIQKIYVLGSGTLAYECAKYAKEKEKDYDTQVYLFEMTDKKSIGLEKKAMAAGIPYQHRERKQKCYWCRQSMSLLFQNVCWKEKILQQ